MSKKIKIWLINPYGPLPDEDWREYSFAIIGKYLSENGYEVTWWTSNFSHHFKTYRSNGYSEKMVNSDFFIKLIPTTGYKKNISVGRVIRYWVFAVRMYLIGIKQEKPDLILYYESMLCCGFAGPALSKFHDCALVYDQMDLWPELIVENMPRPFNHILNLAFQPIYFIRKKVFHKLDGVMALAQPYLESAIEVAPNLKSKPNTVIYNGINVVEFRKKLSPPINPNMKKLAYQKTIKLIFAGSLGPSYDIQCILDLAEIITEKQLPMSIIIAGDGPLKKLVYDAAAQFSCLHYFGKLNSTDLCQLYSICDIGLAAYGPNSNVEMPDKFYDYTAAGLVTVCSLEGEVRSQIEKYSCGLHYKAGDKLSLYSVINKLSQSDVLLKEMKNNALTCANNFSSVRQNKKLLGFLDQIVTNRNK